MAKNWEEYLKENVDRQRVPQWKQYIADHIPPARAGGFDPVAAENGMFNLPETMETMSARKSPAPVPVDGDFDPLVSEAGEGLVIPFVDAIAQAAMRNAPQAVRPTRRVNAMDAITTAADTGFEDFTPEQINTPVNMPALVQDAAATAMAIPYTAASTGVSAANLLTGGMLDDAVTAMNEGERALRQSFGSDELNRQVDAVNAVQQNRDSGLFDVLIAAANNPRALAYDAIRNLGTMALPTGAAIGAGKLAQAAPALSRYVPALGRVAPWMANNAGKIGTGASMAANALMNASDTFSDEEMMKQSLGERYAGSGVSAVTSLLTGALTDGGAEGQIARRILSGRQGAASGALNYLKGLGKSAVKEGLQEYGEESGNYLGKVFGTNGPADFNEMNKQAGYASVLGSLTGSASHVGTNLGGQRQQVEPLSAMEKEMDRRLAVDALRPENAQRVVPNMPNTPGQNDRGDFLSRVVTELEKIRRQNEQQVQARQGQAQRVEPQDVRWNEMPQQEQPAVQASQEAQVSQGSQRGKDETLESLDGQRPADNMPDNPLDIIIANGGIKPEVLKTDLGWTDEEIAKLPEGVVRDDGKALLPMRRALKKAGLDTDVNAILDAASRPEAPEVAFASEDAQLFQSREGDAKRENERMVSSSKDMNVGPVQAAWRSARANGDADYADYFGFYAKSADPGIAPRRMAEDYLQGRRSDFDRVILDNHRKMLGQTVSGNESIRQDAQQIRQTSQPEPGIKQVMRDAVENGQSADGHVVFQQVKNTPKIQPEKQSSTVQFSGEELGGLDVPIKTLKVRAANYARKHFSGKTVTIASDGAQVIIASGGIKKAMSANVSPVAAIVTSKLDKLIENGRYVGTLPDEKKRNTIKAVHYYETPVDVGGKESVVRIVVREHPDGKRYYDHFEVRENFPLRNAERLTGEVPGIHSDQPTKGRKESESRSNASVGPTERVTGSMSGSTAHQPNRSVGETPESSVNEKKVRGNLPTGGTEYLTGAVPGQQTSQLAKEGQPDAAENNVSRPSVKSQEETDPLWERAQSSHSVAGTPRAVSGQSGNETSVNENPSVGNTEPRNGTRQEQMALFSRKRNESKGFTESDSTTAEERAEADRQYDEIEKKYKGTPLWMKAPNGQPTKLTERQWVQVRTPNFKRWFGDWEKAGIRERLEGQEPVPVEAKYRTGSEKERRNIAKLLKIDFIAETDIGSVIVNNSSIKDSLQHGNTDKKLDVLEDLKNIIESSTFLDAVEDFDGKGHRNYYLATRIDRSGSKEIVFFRVRKTAGRDQRLYVHDVFLEEEIKGNPVSALDESRQGAEGNKSNGHPRGPDLYKSILQDIYATDNESISKVLDSNGEPTASDVKAFTNDPKSEPVKYSRKEQQDKGMSVDELRLLADTLVESFHNAPGIVVADRPQDAIPNALPDGMGLFDPNNGKVFLFARNIRDADTARAVFAHEVIAHYGLRGFFGDSLGDVLVSIRNHNPKIERLSQEWWSENQDYIKQVRENEGRNWTEEQFEKWQRDISIEEAMAFFAEQGEKITGVKRLVRKIQELLRDITRRLGWRWPANLANWLESKTDAEALSALHQAGLFARGEISGRTTTTQSDIEKYRVSDDGSSSREAQAEGVDVPAFSKSSPRQGVALDEVRRIADDLAREYKNAPELVVVEKASDLPFDAPDDAKGAYRNGRCFLVASNLDTAEDAKSTFAHEVIGHYGLNGFFGQTVQVALGDILLHNKNVQDAARKWINENKDVIKNTREKTIGKWSDEQFRQWRKNRATEEALAEMAQRGEKVTGVKKLVYAIQKVLRAIGLGNLANMLESRTDAEALMALHKAELFVRSGKNIDAATATDVFVRFARSGNNEAGVFNHADFEVPGITVADRIIRALQDNKIDVKRAQDSIRKAGREISENQDIYMADTLYTSKVSRRLDKLNDEWTKPILQTIHESGVTLEEADDYLYARHVLLDDVNSKLAEINPDEPENDALSGMSDDEARDIMDHFSSNKSLEKLGDLFDKLADRNVQWLVDGGLITRLEAKAWRDKYKHYVPLKRDPEESKPAGLAQKILHPFKTVDEPGTSKGRTNTKNYQTKGKESRRRMGGKRRATNIVANMLANSTTTIIRSEKAAVARTVLDLARANPNPDLWKVDTPEKVRRANRETGLVEITYRDKRFVPADNVLVVKENGVEHWVEFNENSPRAMAIARSLKGMDANNIQWVNDTAGRLNRYMSRWITSRNPVFMVFNFQRDVQNAIFNLSDTELAGHEGEVAKNILPAIRDFYRFVNGKENSGYAQEFVDAGGETGFIDSYGNIHERVSNLEKELKKLNRGNGNPMKYVEGIVSVFDTGNRIIENGVRLAVYKAARENGMSIRKAAVIAKEITVDFNRRGTQSGILNSWWMFTNASIQGNARMIRALVKSKRARVIAAGLIALGFVMDCLGRAVMGDDDETGMKKWDEISEFDKERNWIIPAPWSKEGIIKIPMAQGWLIFNNVGRMLSELCFSTKKRDPMSVAWRIASLVVDSFNPFGAVGSLGQFIAPSAVRPIIQITENKSFTGNNLYREKTAYGGYTPPAYQRAWSSTPQHWIKLSKALNDVSGGDDIRSGSLNIPPEAIQTAITSFLIPGLSTNIDKFAGTMERGKSVSASEIPVISRMYSKVPDERVQERNVYDRLSDLRDDINVINEYRKQGRLKEARECIRELGEGDYDKGLRIYKGYDAFTNRLKELSHAERQAEKKNNEVALKNIEAARRRLFARFLSSQH